EGSSFKPWWFNEEIFPCSDFVDCFGDGGLGASAGPQFPYPARKRDGGKPDYSNCRFIDGVVGRSGPACHGDEFHAIRGGSVVLAVRARAAKHASQFDSH